MTRGKPAWVSRAAPKWSEVGLPWSSLAGSVETEAFCFLRSQILRVTDLGFRVQVRLLVAFVPVTVGTYLRFTKKVCFNKLIPLGDYCQVPEHSTNAKQFLFTIRLEVQAKKDVVKDYTFHLFRV